MSRHTLKACDILDLIENGNISDLENLSDREEEVGEFELPADILHVEDGINFGDDAIFEDNLMNDIEGDGQFDEQLDNILDIDQAITTVIANNQEVLQEQDIQNDVVPAVLDNADQRGMLFNNIVTSKREIQWKNEMFTTRNPPDWDLEFSTEYTMLPSPLIFFQKYVPKSILETARDCTNIYAMQNNKTSFKDCTLLEIETAIALHIAMGSLNLPRVKMYWDSSLNIGLFRDAQMPLKRFFSIRNNLHFVNNLERPNNNDIFFKVRPLLDCIASRCRQIQVERYMSVDEQIIPFTGKNLSVKQYVKGKPCPWGIKNFILAGKSGMMYDFVLYQGQNTELDKDYVRDFGLGATVVLKLVENLKPGNVLFFDNYFSSYALLQILKSKMIFAACTARLNRFSKPPLTSDKIMMKEKRGFSEEVVSDDGDVVVTKWLDNKTVSLASNYVGIGQTDTVKRWEKRDKAYIQVTRPQVVNEYNSAMGGVDLYNRYIALYRITVRSKKWTLRVIFHAIDMAVTNSWLEYKRTAQILKVPKKEQLDLLAFRLQLTEEIIKVGKPVTNKKKGRPSNEKANKNPDENMPQTKRSRYEQRPLQSVQTDSVDHLPTHDGKPEPTRCKNSTCGKYRSHFFCHKCKVHLCINQKRNCFYEFHTKK